MTTRLGNTIILCDEPDGVCDLCGKKEEVRPYGPSFCNVCYECGMKDKEATDARMHFKLFDIPIPAHLETKQ